MEKTNWGSVKHFSQFEIQWSKVKVTTSPSMGKILALEPQLHSNIPDGNFCQSHHMTKYGQKFSFGSITPLKCIRWKILSTKRLVEAMLSISKNFRSKAQISRSPHDQIWAKSQFWSLNSIQIYQIGTFFSFQTYWGSVKHFWKIEVQKWSAKFITSPNEGKISFGSVTP